MHAPARHAAASQPSPSSCGGIPRALLNAADPFGKKYKGFICLSDSPLDIEILLFEEEFHRLDELDLVSGLAASADF